MALAMIIGDMRIGFLFLPILLILTACGGGFQANDHYSFSSQDRDSNNFFQETFIFDDFEADFQSDNSFRIQGPESEAVVQYQENSGGTMSCQAMGAEACQMHQKINSFRRQLGLSALGVSKNCFRASQSHAEDMSRRGYFSHNAPDESWFERMNRFGVRGLRAENIAKTSTLNGAYNGWLNSSGHYKNIVNPSVKYSGVGFSNGYWVQCFTNQP